MLVALLTAHLPAWDCSQVAAALTATLPCLGDVAPSGGGGLALLFAAAGAAAPGMAAREAGQLLVVLEQLPGYAPDAQVRGGGGASRVCIAHAVRCGSQLTRACLLACLLQRPRTTLAGGAGAAGCSAGPAVDAERAAAVRAAVCGRPAGRGAAAGAAGARAGGPRELRDSGREREIEDSAASSACISRRGPLSTSLHRTTACLSHVH